MGWDMGGGNACAAYRARTETVRGSPTVLECLTFSIREQESVNRDARMRLPRIHRGADVGSGRWYPGPASGPARQRRADRRGSDADHDFSAVQNIEPFSKVE